MTTTFWDDISTEERDSATRVVASGLTALTGKQMRAMARIGLDPLDVADWTEKEAQAFLDDFQRVGGYWDEDLYLNEA